MGTEQRAFGTILKNGSTTIGNLVSVSFSGMQADTKDTTHHGLSEPYRTFRTTIVDPGEITARVQMTSEQFATLWSYLDPEANATTWSIEYPFSTPITVSCNGFLTTISILEAEVDGILEAEITIKLTGSPTLS